MIPPIIRQASAFITNKPLPKYQRFLAKRIDFKNRLIGIKGARGSGKTTLLLQYVSSSGLPKDRVLYIACDHPALIGADLYQIAQTFYQEGGKLLLIDEIHKSASFGVALKAIYDTFDIQVIFSGSSALRIENELADLSRRAVVYDMPVLSFREFIEIETGLSLPSFSLKEITENQQNIAAQITRDFRPIEWFKKYLQYGAYPFYKESIESYSQKLLEVINITIDSDLSGLYKIDPAKVDKLKKVLYLLCSTPPLEQNKSKLSGAVETSWPTLSKYLDLMQEGGLIQNIRSGKGMRVVNKSNKILLNNPNLFHVLCASPDIGSIRESFFVSQLITNHQVHQHDKGDFIVDEKYVFEIGGAGKTKRQIKDTENAWIVADDIEIGSPQQIPLWLFGMSY